MKLLIGQLALAAALLATPALAQDTPAQTFRLADKTVQWLITPPTDLPQTFAEQTKVVAEWEAGAKATTIAYGTDHLLKRSASIEPVPTTK